MSGRYSRDKGARYERKCAKELREAFGVDVQRTRALGATYGADLATVTAKDAHDRPVTHVPSVLGWSVECKDTERWAPEAWLEQAVGQAAPGTVPVVLANRSNCPFETGWAITVDEEWGWRATSIGNWIAAQTVAADAA